MTTTVPAHVRPLLAGAAVVAVGVGLAFLAGAAVPALGPLTAAVLIGVATGTPRALGEDVRRGIARLTKRLLRAGVVLLGLRLALPAVLELGAGTLLAVVLTVAVTFVGTLGLGRLLGVSRGLTTLVATGFSICGASAVAAMEGVIDRRDADVATAVALVTAYGSLAIGALPLLGSWLGLDDRTSGEWAGASVHEVAQVVAAATPAGAGAVAVAVVVKLSRVVLLAPLVAIIGVRERRRAGVADRGGRTPLVPLFVLGFLAMVAVRTTGMVPAGLLESADVLCSVALTAAMFGLGCAVRIGALVRTGGRALLLGLLSTVLIAGTALGTLIWLG